MGKDAVKDEQKKAGAAGDLDKKHKPNEVKAKTIERDTLNASRNDSPGKELSHVTSLKTSENFLESLEDSRFDAEKRKIDMESINDKKT